ncbi:MAG: hypothetical protein QXY11_05360 [Desulfurococcaceae archaeon]
MKVSGLDLAAESHNCSGYAVVDLDTLTLVKAVCLYSDDEIVNNVLADKVRLVSVDSPLIRDPVFRRIDREAIRRGFRVLPPNFGYMKKLTLRGWTLYERLSREGGEVIETNPRSALISSGISDCFTLAERLGLNLGIYRWKVLSKDIRDAIVSALVAFCYVRRDCLLTISAEDGKIHLIKPVS